MNLTGRRVIPVIVCLGLVPVVAALVGCGRSQEQAESEAPMPQVAEHEPADSSLGPAEAEEPPAPVDEPADAAEAGPASEPEPVKPEASVPKAEAAEAARQTKPPAPSAEKPSTPQPLPSGAPSLTPGPPRQGSGVPGGAKAPPSVRQDTGAGGTAPGASDAGKADTHPGPSETPPERGAEKPQGTVVVGKIQVVSNVPDPGSVPYDTCVTFIKYRVESVESGGYDAKELLAVFWGMQDGELRPAASFSVGQRHRLTIEPFSERGELARVMQADDTNEYSLTPYWVTSYAGG